MVEEPFVQVISERLECKSPVVFCGFPGMGLVGNIVTQHLIEQLSMKQKGFIESRLFPPLAIIYGGHVKSPVRVYEDPVHEIVVIFSDIPIEPIISKEVGKSLVKWFKEINPKEVVPIAGLATPGELYRVYGAASNDEEYKKIKDNLEIFEMGTISGVPGVIITECMNNNIPSYCLLGETRGPNPDPRAGAEVIKMINRIYGLELDIKPLIEQAEQIEQMLHKLSEQLGEAEVKTQPFKDYTIYG
jgi:uncharacterized protein